MGPPGLFSVWLNDALDSIARGTARPRIAVGRGGRCAVSQAKRSFLFERGEALRLRNREATPATHGDAQAD